MEAAFFQKTSTFLILTVSFIFLIVWNKTLIITLPAFIFNMYLYYPGSDFLQILLAVLWVLMVMGHGRVTAYSMVDCPKSLGWLLVAIWIVAAIIYFFINYSGANIHTLRGLGDFILEATVIGFMISTIAFFVIIRVLCPLVILGEKRINTVVADYYNRGSRGNYIRFRDDIEAYPVNMFLFRKFRGRIDAPVTYMKYRCPFKVYFIREIEIDTGSVEKLSEWETDPNTEKEKKEFMFVMVCAAVSFALLLLVCGLRG